MALTKVTGDFIETGSITQGHLHSSHGITLDHIGDGSTNTFFTTANARSAISATGSLSYNNSTGVMSFTMPTLNTTNITEGNKLFFTDARARASISASGNSSYNSTTGVITSTDTNTTYTVGDGGLTQNNFTNTLKGKLDGIADSATNVTNTNQLTNGAGFITSYTEADTLASVLGRGSSTTHSITSLNTNGTSLSGLSVGEAFANYAGWNTQLNVHGAPHARIHVKTSTVQMGIYAHNTWHDISGSTVNGHVGTYTNHGLGFLVNTDPKMVINTSGQVGINQDSPTTTLHVGGVITATGGTSTNWNTAYTTANAALPKTGGTLTGNLNTSGNANHIIIGGVAASNQYNAVTSTTGLSFGGGTDFNNYSIGTTSENFGGSYTKLNIKWHTGIRFFAMNQYGGVRFYSDVGLATKLFSIGEGDAHVRVSNNLYTTGTVTGSNLSGTHSGTSSGSNTGNQTHGGNGVSLATSFASMPSSHSGFHDNWNTSDLPSGMSHVHGASFRHHNNTSNSWGWQMVAQYNSPGEIRARWVNGGTFSSWYSVLTSSGGTLTGNLTAPRFNVDNGSNYIDTVSNYLSFTSAGNEMTIGGSSTMYINYRAPNGGTPLTWYWKAGSSGSWANHNFGNVGAAGYIELFGSDSHIYGGSITSRAALRAIDVGYANTSCYISASRTASNISMIMIGGTSNQNYIFNRASATDTSGRTMVVTRGNTNAFLMNGGSGYVTFYGGHGNSSDRLLKKNIEDSNYGLEAVNNLKPRRFFWKDETVSKQKQIGFIAQEVEEVLPESVRGYEGDKSIIDNSLISVLTKAIQELSQEVTALKAEVESLKE